MEETHEDLELFHYGVKGMRWGVRRPIDTATGLIKKSSANRQARKKEREDFKAEKKQQRQDNAKALRREKMEDRYNRREKFSRPVTPEARRAERGRKRIKAHGTDAMSNKELQDLVTRMNLEQQYSALMDNQKASTRRAGASRYVRDILKEAGSSLLKDAATAAAGAAFKAAMNYATGKNSTDAGYTQAFKVAPTTIEAPRKQIGR